VSRRHWERSEPPLALTADQLQALVHESFPGRAVATAALTEGGLSNTNYRIALEGRADPVRLRLYQRGSATGRLEEAVGALLGDEVPVPRILHRNWDAPIPFAFLEWKEGERLEEAWPLMAPRLRSESGEEIGRLLGVVHGHRFARTGFLAPDLTIARPFEISGGALRAYARACLVEGPGADRLGSPLAERFTTWLAAASAILDRDPPAPRLCHGDFGASNILVTPAGTVAAVLDWEYACSGVPTFDLGNLLRPPVGDDAAFVDAVARGYRGAGGTLPTDWLRVALVADLFAWLERLERPLLPDSVVRAVRLHLDRTIAAIPV
jgi:aminoglycoside phosphotransferase (APT) family kinase protein